MRRERRPCIVHFQGMLSGKREAYLAGIREHGKEELGAALKAGAHSEAGVPRAKHGEVADVDGAAMKHNAIGRT